MSAALSARLRALPLPVSLLIRLVIGGTFIYASLDKIAHPEGFAQSIYYYRMVPASLLHVMALCMPWLELVTGLALITGFRQRGAALLIAAMLVMFVFAIVTALARDLDISCGCFSTGEGHGVGLNLIWRDSLMILGCLLILWQRR
jgi:uncharacterized membrane protein YphA (DoxX/SURF4 family)